MAKVMVIGSGGREHALEWKLGQSPLIDLLYMSPGNGRRETERFRNTGIDSTLEQNFQRTYDFAKKNGIDYIVVGPEAPAANGIWNFFYERGFENILCPSRMASNIESDKFYSYDINKRLNIPQAFSVKCNSKLKAKNAIRRICTDRGVVIKARGLKGGHGVKVCDRKGEAIWEIEHNYHKYGPDVLISERLFGEEVSVFGLSDGRNISLMETSIQDFKKELDGDLGDNTGGMGAYGRTNLMNDEMLQGISTNIMQKIVDYMSCSGHEYKGFLYTGVILTDEGIKVLEYNARLGDPETQVMAMTYDGDFFEPIVKAIEGNLGYYQMKFKTGSACCVVLALNDYPRDYKKNLGLKISGFEEAESLKNLMAFHAGTIRKGEDVLTDGGRVIGVTGYSDYGIGKAHEITYEGVSKFSMEGGFKMRTDIALKAIRSSI